MEILETHGNLGTFPFKVSTTGIFPNILVATPPEISSDRKNSLHRDSSANSSSPKFIVENMPPEEISADTNRSNTTTAYETSEFMRANNASNGGLETDNNNNNTANAAAAVASAIGATHQA